MPLLVITGPPASGKSTIVDRLAANFKAKGFDKITVINDQDNSSFSREIYNNFKMVNLFYFVNGLININP